MVSILGYSTRLSSFACWKSKAQSLPLHLSIRVFSKPQLPPLYMSWQNPWVTPCPLNLQSKKQQKKDHNPIGSYDNQIFRYLMLQPFPWRTVSWFLPCAAHSDFHVHRWLPSNLAPNGGLVEADSIQYWYEVNIGMIWSQYTIIVNYSLCRTTSCMIVGMSM